jgi:hypothetical protein
MQFLDINASRDIEVGNPPNVWQDDVMQASDAGLGKRI